MFSRCCQQHEMSVRSLAVLLLGMVAGVVSTAIASRLPLVAFQHHYNYHHHMYDEQDIQQHEDATAPASESHYFPQSHHFGDGRGIRILYQVGVSLLEFNGNSDINEVGKLDNSAHRTFSLKYGDGKAKIRGLMHGLFQQNVSSQSEQKKKKKHKLCCHKPRQMYMFPQGNAYGMGQNFNFKNSPRNANSRQSNQSRHSSIFMEP